MATLILMSNTNESTPYHLLWILGMEMHMQGRPKSDCLTRPEREGWQAMDDNEEEIDALTDEAADTDEYQDWQEDVEWMRSWH